MSSSSTPSLPAQQPAAQDYKEDDVHEDPAMMREDSALIIPDPSIPNEPLPAYGSVVQEQPYHAAMPYAMPAAQPITVAVRRLFFGFCPFWGISLQCF